jgi:serine/threonine protein kinase
VASVPPAIGKYQVIDRLGQGGMGTLYLARDPGLDRLVAIKVLRGDFEDADLRERFSREARTVSNLIHDNIVIIYEYGDFEGQPFIAMQYVAGESLAEIIRRRATLPLDRKLQMVDELCAGMAFAHRAKIVHRDLKPANIMLDADRGLIKILDFGIARNVEANVTLFTQVIGTPSYMSPEQAGGRRVDYRSDIFAIGVVTYELLSYRKAFDGDSASAIQHKILAEDPVPLAHVCPGIDAGIVAIVQKAIEKDPAARYQDLKAMRSDLSRAMERAARSTQDATIVVSPPGSSFSAATPSPAPHLEQRRASQIKIHLDAAAASLRDNNYDAAIESCEHVLLLHATHETAIALLQKARAGVERLALERHLSRAREHLRTGALTMAEQELAAAARLAVSDLALAALQRELQQARREAERAMERAAAAESALSRARSSFEDGAYESALRAASEALAHAPDSTEARGLKMRANDAIDARARDHELERLATQAIAAARTRFDEGRQASAIRALEELGPTHPMIGAALTELREKRDAIEEERRRQEEEEEERQRQERDRQLQEEERRRAAEAERQERLERAAGLLAACREQLTSAEFDRALSSLAAAERLEPALEGLAELRTQALLRRAAAERQRKVAARLVEAERLLGSLELDKALTEVDAALALDPGENNVRALGAKIQRAIEDRRRELSEQEARASEAARLKEEAERRLASASALLVTSRRLLASGDHDGALAALTDAEHLDPALPGLPSLRDQAIAARAAAEAAAQAAAKRGHELAARVAAAEQLFARLDLDKALQEADAALAVEPGDRKIRRLRSAIQQAIEDQQRTRVAEQQAQAEAERRAKQEVERHEALEKERLERAAAEAAARAAAERANELAARLTAAERFFGRREIHRALNEVNAALELEPKNTKAQQLRLALQKALEDQEQADKERRKAEEAAAQALAKRQRQLAAKIAAAERLLKAEKLDKALDEVNDALALDPGAESARQLLADVQRAIEERRRARGTLRQSKVDATLLSAKPDDERRPVDATQLRQDQPTQVVAAPRRDETIAPAVAGPRWSRPLLSGIAALIVVAGTVVVWKWMQPAQPSPVEQPAGRPQGGGNENPIQNVDPLTAHRARVATQRSQGQPENVLQTTVDALRIKRDDPQFLQLLDELFSDSQVSAQRSRATADQAKAATLAPKTYALAEAAQQAGRQRGAADQTGTGVRSSWNARDLFLKATDEARAADKLAADKLAADKLAADKLAADKLAADKLAADKLAADKLAADKLAADKLAADKLAADRLAADRLAADRLAADRLAATRLAERQLAAAKQDEQNARNVLDRYVAAYNSLSTAALASVVSNQLGAQIDFDSYRSYRLVLTGTRIQIDGNSATVTCTREIDAVLKRGNTPSKVTRGTTFKMQRSGGSWVIVSVN